MPRVVAEQRQKFENDDLFRKMSRETEIKYTGYRDRSHEERIVRFQTEARDGQANVAFVSSGTNFTLQFPKGEDGTVPKDYLDFDREPGKVYIKSRFIMNGVCVVWKGWLDLQRLDGAGYLEFDEDKAKNEDKVMKETLEQAKRRLAEFEDRQRQWREEQQRKESEAKLRGHSSSNGPQK
ncbi:PREDICTED: core-binding factor subunit beta-like isoform X1 [Acropora digitifera]|uniref:core-binding factor subunit beta-like isoform X1 n=1 Tax=Acropora digitifera TaxID=70779 RepID=UPI00077B21EC|nr:PREDICTED: core-binding factor subunit beta-like isoform X1 [Acropora digitifera]XP_029186510.1 core-binding factor subunit beta-like isoform X1 [Acropora millepora]